MPDLGSRSQPELARLVPELLLAGHLIDRAGMPYLISAFGMEAMRDIAIDEWMGASPVYTRRMQQALGFAGDSVETIFKGLQIDIGAPPQFMDFRYRLHDHDRGEFWLDHCGALMDVEPMGEAFVLAMCHDIEDPTFDATAIATNARAQIRPIHRPPRRPTDRHPHCHWTVVIADDHDAVPVPAAAQAIARTRAAQAVLAPIDPTEPGHGDYQGPLLDDLRFEDWSRSALVRIAEEVCLQGQLLALAFRAAVRSRVDTDAAADDLLRRQCTGVAGVAATRLKDLLGLGSSMDDLAALLAVHPALLPTAYTGVGVELDDDGVVLTLPTDSDAVADGGWLATVDADHLAPLDAIVRAIDPRFRAAALDPAAGEDGTLRVQVVVDDEPARLAEEVVLTRFSTGADFAFADRGTPVQVRATA